MAAAPAGEENSSKKVSSAANVAKISNAASPAAAAAADDVVDWDKLRDMSSEPRRRRRGRIREIPETYFLPRKSFLGAIAYYGAFAVAGVGAGMIVEQWIKKKIAEDKAVVVDLSQSKTSK